MAKPQHRKETEKAIRSTIRLKFSVLADRAIKKELDRLEEVESRGDEYTLNLEEIFDGIGQV